MPALAITGGTGFVGRHLIDQALAAGHQVRALTRRPQPDRPALSWIEGALDTPMALDRLVEGADAVIHVAGVTNAPDLAAFRAGNVAGTRAIVAAAQAAGVERFVHVSSLAAREPQLSIYGASKADAEAVVAASELNWIIVRPPAVYGPGDMDMLDIFRVAKYGLALTPPPGRLSVIHAADLAALLLVLAADPSANGIVEPDDGKAGGWTHAEFFGEAIGAALGKRVKTVALSRPLLSLAARADRLLRGSGAKLTADRVGYMCHPDWTADPARKPDPALWYPRISTGQGLAETVRWYRAQGLL